MKGIVMKPILFVSCLICILLVGCKSDSTGPSAAANLVQNPYFVDSGKPSFNGWSDPDTNYVSLKSEKPPELQIGYSLLIKPALDWEWNRIHTLVSLPPGFYKFKWSCWMKGIEGSGGTFWFFRYRGGVSTGWGLRVSEDSVWEARTWTDTMTIRAEDILYVEITGGEYPTGMTSGPPTYFYHPQFEIVNPAGSTVVTANISLIKKEFKREKR